MTTSEIAAGGLRAAEARGRRGAREAARPRRRLRRRRPVVQPEARARSARDRRAAWLQRDELRHAISMAVDRQLFADTVFLGAGVPVVRPDHAGEQEVVIGRTLPQTPHDPAGAQRAARVDRPRPIATATACSRTRAGRPVRFTLVTQKGRPRLERGAAVIRDELKKIGVTVDVVTLDGERGDRAVSCPGKYEAVYFSVDTTDTDPASNPDFWLSSGSAHIWNLGQKTPATAWEAADRRADGAPDRVGRRGRAQARCSTRSRRSSPSTCRSSISRRRACSSPRRARVTNVTPAVQRPQLLWSPDTVAVTVADDRATSRGGSSSRCSWCSPCRRRRWCWRGSRRATSSAESLGTRRQREALEAARARYGLDRVDRRAVPRLARRRGAPRFRRSRCCTTGRCADLIPERAANTAHPRAHRARSSRRSSACRSASSPAAAAAALLPGAIRAASLVLLSMPPLLTSLFLRLRRGAHRLAADRRDDARRPAGGGARRSAAPPGRAGGGARRCRSPRCSSGCSRRR